jgi:hypothetical protein
VNIAGPTQLRHTATTWDYSPLDGAIKARPKAKPQNSDGVLTQHETGRVLFIENMKGGEESINSGECMTYTDVANLNPAKGTVVVVKHGDAKREDGAFLFNPKYILIWGKTDWVECNLEQFRERINNWWNEGLR